jgi:hypothetical protein
MMRCSAALHALAHRAVLAASLVTSTDTWCAHARGAHMLWGRTNRQSVTRNVWGTTSCHNPHTHPPALHNTASALARAPEVQLADRKHGGGAGPTHTQAPARTPKERVSSGCSRRMHQLWLAAGHHGPSRIRTRHSFMGHLKHVSPCSSRVEKPRSVAQSRLHACLQRIQAVHVESGTRVCRASSVVGACVAALPRCMCASEGLRGC